LTHTKLRALPFGAIAPSARAEPSVAAAVAFFRREHDIGAILLENAPKQGEKPSQRQTESNPAVENGL
jgi:hypothetical protein